MSNYVFVLGYLRVANSVGIEDFSADTHTW